MGALHEDQYTLLIISCWFHLIMWKCLKQKL